MTYIHFGHTPFWNLLAMLDLPVAPSPSNTIFRVGADPLSSVIDIIFIFIFMLLLLLAAAAAAVI